MNKQAERFISWLNLVGEGNQPFVQFLKDRQCQLIEMYYGHYEVTFPEGTRRELISSPPGYEHGLFFRLELPDGHTFIEQVHSRGWYGWLYGIPFLLDMNETKQEKHDES